MNVVGMWIMIGLGGIIIGAVGGFFFGGDNPIISAMVGAFAGVIPFMAIMQVIGYARTKGFLPLFKNLEKNEKYAWVPNKMNKVKLFIMKEPHPNILVRKGLGVFEHKGTEFAFGNSPMCFAFPDSAYTVDFPTEHYFSKVEKENGLDEYEECVKEYLGEDKYKIFCKYFRENPKPDYYSIDNEIQWLINNKPKANGNNNAVVNTKTFADLQRDYENKNIDDDTEFTVEEPVGGVNNGSVLSKNVFGETVDFTNRLKFLRYNYNPISGENATEREKLISLKEGMEYKDRELDKYGARAKAIVMIIFGVMIAILVLFSGVIDWSAIFGG